MRPITHLDRLVAMLALEALCALAACSTPDGAGDSSGGGGNGGSSNGGSGGASTQVGAGGAPVLPPIQALPATAPVVCDGGLRPRAYILGAYHTILELDPETLEMHSLGTFTCPPLYDQPMRMTVSQAGFAYLLFQDANIYRVDLTTLECTTTAYVPAQLGFDDRDQLINDLGSEWLAIAPSDDRLYMIGDTIKKPTLASSDLVDFELHQVGAIEPVFYVEPNFLTDMKMDAFGRIFALAYDGTLAQIDATTGAVVAEDHTGFYANSGSYGGCAPALLPYDGALYLIGGCDDGILRYDLATKALEPLGQLLESVWAVSATACVHAPSEPDAGADAAADAGAPASDAALE